LVTNQILLVEEELVDTDLLTHLIQYQVAVEQLNLL
jgi:hypothetical protein